MHQSSKQDSGKIDIAKIVFVLMLIFVIGFIATFAILQKITSDKNLGKQTQVAREPIEISTGSGKSYMVYATTSTSPTASPSQKLESFKPPIDRDMPYPSQIMGKTKKKVAVKPKTVIKKKKDPAKILPDAQGLNIEIDKSRFLMSVYNERNQLLCQYKVTVGKDDKENATPSGIYKIGDIEYDPPWGVPARVQQEEGLPASVEPYRNYLPAKTKKEGNPNALGVVWISINWRANWSDNDPGWPESDLGIHGTNDPEMIGGPYGHGCVRMHNTDVLKLVKMIETVGREFTTVVVKSN